MFGQVMLDLEGFELTPEERELIAHPHVGGIIFFKRNFYSPDQLQALIKELRKMPKENLLIGVDHEGGRVQRFKEGFTTLPPMRFFGELYEDDPVTGIECAERCAWVAAAELRAYDIDLSFAPVLDLDRGISQVIGDRAFHSNPMIVSVLAKAFCKGMKHGGLAPVGKHFPGHGSVAADSHTEIPVDERNFIDIKTLDMLPFIQLSVNDLAGIMPAHVIYPNVDPLPAGFSSHWIIEVLRQQLGFAGAVFSDDLGMVGASHVGDFVARAEQAFSAGCDMILVCNDRSNAIKVVDNLKQTSNKLSHHRLVQMQGKPVHYTPAQLQEIPVFQDAKKILQQYIDRGA